MSDVVPGGETRRRRPDGALLRVVAMLVAVATLAACGSTAQVGGAGRDRVAGPGEVVSENGMPLSDTAGTAAASANAGDRRTSSGPATAAGGSASATSGAAGATPPAVGAARPSSSRDPESPPSPQTGVTETHITIGFLVVENSDAAYEAAGVEGFTRGQQREYVRILVDHINAQGGIAGREVQPVIHVQDSTGTNTSEQNAQAACATWTEDNAVFAVAMDSGFVRPTLRDCLQQRGVALITSGVSLVDTQVFREAPHYIEIAGLPIDPLARTQVAALHARGYFESDSVTPTTIGLLYLDTPAYERAKERAMKPALAAVGLHVAEEQGINQPGSQANFGDFVAQINAAVLRFKSSGVTHVLFLEPGGGLAFFFMNGAEAQAYRPRYGLHSQNGGQALLGDGQVPPEQLETSIGIGFLPATDVRMEDRQDTPGGRRCLDVMQRQGLELSDAGAISVAFVFCDTMFFLQAAGDTAAASLTTDGLIRGAESLGRTFSAGYTFATSFGPDRHHGADAYRYTTYDTACTCFRYDGAPRQVR